MIRYLTLTACLVILIGSTASFASAQSKMTRAREERLITALINSKTIPGLFGDDGLFRNDLSPDLEYILKLGKRAIPLLISHLDDRRVFKHMMFYGDPNHPTKVTMGEGALDILTVITRSAPPVIDAKCANDEFRVPEDRCVADGFGFGKRGKRNWLRAFRAGKVIYEKYEYVYDASLTHPNHADPAPYMRDHAGRGVDGAGDKL